jgi:leucyl aminopeptidase
MLAQLRQFSRPLTARTAAAATHVLVVLPKTGALDDAGRVPYAEALQRVLSRRRRKLSDLAKEAVATQLPHGGLAAWVMVDTAAPAFTLQTSVRKGLELLLSERPRQLTLAVFGTDEARRRLAEVAVYAAWVNGSRLPERKKKRDAIALQRIELHGHQSDGGFADVRALALGNTLCRELTVLPPNELTPGDYRARLKALAREQGWEREEYDVKRLRRMGAGAFVAVAQGSAEADAAVVHLRYRPSTARKTVALIGKGICFDTGGHNLKTARYMHGMHEDMNGSAVALGILLAATEARLPVGLDCWLALARNDIGPRAYRQNEVVTAFNGTTIEIVHTDAEGRMVLADTLALAARARPDLMIDFATLTGSMHTALGDRYSGIFATSEELARQALAAGAASGERVCLFPMDADYDSALDSAIADIKQCTMEGHADHILAARFLKRFTENRPWIHMDLSASSCKGGLGAVGSDVTGFGVAWGAALLRVVAGIGEDPPSASRRR